MQCFQKRPLARPLNLDHSREKGVAARLRAENIRECEKQGRLRLINPRDGRDGSIVIYHNLDFYASLLANGDAVTHKIGPERGGWVQVSRG